MKSAIDFVAVASFDINLSVHDSSAEDYKSREEIIKSIPQEVIKVFNPLSKIEAV